MKMHIAGFRLFAATLSLAVGACGAGENGSRGLELGFKVNDNATARAVGLPTYPGSKPYKDGDDDSSAADIGISTPLFGLKVVAMELETADKPERVAAFYRRALSKYGDVLECNDADDRKRNSESSADSDAVTCDPDEPGRHSVVYKVGTEKNQRIVAIEPHGKGTRFSLVHVDIRDDSEK
jgi:hypothetical protein